jgi:hypothetical protein
MGCGAGRNGIPLVSAGLHLDGLDVPAEALRRMQAPPGTRFATKRQLQWMEDTAHPSGTCDEELPYLVIQFTSPIGPAPDAAQLAGVQGALAARRWRARGGPSPPADPSVRIARCPTSRDGRRIVPRGAGVWLAPGPLLGGLRTNTVTAGRDGGPDSRLPQRQTQRSPHRSHPPLTLRSIGVDVLPAPTVSIPGVPPCTHEGHRVALRG